MRALVVDDEPFARRRLIRMLEAIGGVEVIGEAGDGIEAMDAVTRLAPDVVFLDIRMPGLDGLSLAAEGRGRLPPVVFTTAYDEYAVRAFEAEAVDYLLKPIEPTRLRQAVERVRRLGSSTLASRLEAVVQRLARGGEAPRITARSGGSLHVFDAQEIARFEAANKYVTFEHGGRRYLTEESLGSLERRLGDWGFVRVHRGELVNIRRVVAVHQEGSTATVELAGGVRVPVSRRQIAHLRRALGVAESGS